jgi:hypothetical protein
MRHLQPRGARRDDDDAMTAPGSTRTAHMTDLRTTGIGLGCVDGVPGRRRLE